MSVVVDTSALVAVVFGEPDAERFASALAKHSGDLLIAAPTRVELGIVVQARQGDEAVRDLESLLSVTGTRVEAFDAEQASLAVAAWRRFGKGRHPAGLNLGDCHAYALAKWTGSPLLYKGADFDQTDIACAM